MGKKQLDIHEMKMIFAVYDCCVLTYFHYHLFIYVLHFDSVIFPSVSGNLSPPKVKSFSWVKILPGSVLTLT